MLRRYWTVAALLVLTSAGCGGPRPGPLPDHGSEDGRAIAEFIDYFNDYKADADKFKKSFATAAPANRREYDPFRFEVRAGSAKVDGAGATATVDVYRDSSRELVVSKEWAFTKVGDAWKLKDAPLK
jgi:hypothetical protein